MGFGALTRLPELSCAGVQAIVSRHATLAIDSPPGTEIVDDDWDAWWAKMEEMGRDVPRLSLADYEAWEASQPRILTSVVKRIIS
jgi:hypothetical protein